MVRVVSCRYMRISCSEDNHPLFRRYYARSNRERGVKLLRCFPHCCPEHVQRCYCGSSVHVLVTFTAEVSAASQRNLLVCARFEPSRGAPLWPMNLANGEAMDEKNEHRLRPGEVVSLPETLLSTDTRKATQSLWIRADREGESKQTYKVSARTKEKKQKQFDNRSAFPLRGGTEDKYLWQYRLAAINCGFREKGQHLLILWRFLQNHSLRDLKFTEAATSRAVPAANFGCVRCSRWLLHEVLAESGSFTRGNQHASIPTLVDEVLSLVYIQPRFRHLRVGFVALLMDQRPVGSLSETLNCSPKDYRHEMRLVDAMQLISEIGCVDFTVEDDASGLSVRSAVSMSASACMTLVLDGKLRVFRVLPSGISSMIATTGGWSIGDYTAAFAEDGRSLEVNIFSFAESMSNGLTPGDAQSINSRSSASDGTVKLRRVSLLIRLEQEFNKEATGSTVQGDLCAFVHGTVYGSTLSLPLNECRNGFKLSERSAVDRAATWSEVEWAALWELKAVYITLSRAFS
ncbi:hypothetical protein GQ600_18729 [Phytophthora cactorum]|nr:hypothetical protein GQ600_18729 [Phytophthora cactorum]